MPLRRSRQATTPGASSSETAQLPAYQTPSAPLNISSQQALQRLQSQDKQKKLLEHFKALCEEIPQSAYTATSALAGQEQWMQKRKAKFGEEDTRYKSRISTVSALSERVDELSSALESKMREVIDAQSRHHRRQDALREISTNATRNNARSMTTATQSTLGASQFRSRQVEEDEEDEDPANPITSNAGPGIKTLLKQRIDESSESYGQLSLAQRYAEHNDYIQFRRILHEGQHADDEAERPVMPHASTWFDADGPVFVCGTQNLHSTQENGGDDSEVEAVAETLNMNCPITLQIMSDPVKSRKCPHAFERSAIESMLQHSTTRTNGRSGQRSIKCHVCDVMLTADDLVADAVLKRRIERKAASQSRLNGGLDEEDEEGNGESMAKAQSVDSQFEPNLPDFTRIKGERMSGVQLVTATQVTDDGAERRMRRPISTRETVDLETAE